MGCEVRGGARFSVVALQIGCADTDAAPIQPDAGTFQFWNNSQAAQCEVAALTDALSVACSCYGQSGVCPP